MDIDVIVKQCRVLLLDIEGTTTSISFVKDILFPYAEENVKEFLESEWESNDVKEVVAALRKLALEDKENSVDGVIIIPEKSASKQAQIEGLVNNVKWQMSKDRKSGALKQLQGLIWKRGYDSGEIKGHVYDDVLFTLKQWRSEKDHKIYIYSSGSVQAQKLLFGQSTAGDLLKFIDGHFDTAVGPKQEPQSYKRIVKEIGCEPSEILFLTDILKEAVAASEAGLHAALVCRTGNAPLPAELNFPVLYSLNELIDRKDSEQEEQPVKRKSDYNSEQNTSKHRRKMESDDNLTETRKAPIIETYVEEITDSNEATGDEIEAELLVIDDKSEKSDTDSLKTDFKDIPEINENDKIKVPTVITVIEELDSAKPSPGEATEIIDDIEPVVEEPNVEDNEILRNASEMLTKECDEVLTKVDSVTNLNNIKIKPLLKPIIEENVSEYSMNNTNGKNIKADKNYSTVRNDSGDVIKTQTKA